MAKYKTPKPKSSAPASPRAGLPCVIIVIAGFFAVLIFLILVMKYAS
jgi:hypothetical protein